MKKLVIHPLLFAAFPILFLFSHNIDEVMTKDLVLPILVSMSIAAILLVLFKFITNSYEKGGIITAAFLMLFFSYGHIAYLILSWGIGGDIAVHLALLSLWLLFFITAIFLVLRLHWDFVTATKLLNIVAIALISISLINIGIYEVRAMNLREDRINDHTISLSPNTLDYLPDIYYVIVDEYARNDTLKSFWDYDNSEFTDYLTSRGFFVASESRANYAHTRLSLASSLSMQYINYLSESVKEQHREIVLSRMVSNSEVSRLLKSIGYRYIHVTSGGPWKDMGQYAEVLEYKGKFGIKISDFVRSLVHTTALHPIDRYLGGFLSKREHYENRLYVFDKIGEVVQMEGPKFVFVYICCPHPAFVFDRYGNPLPQIIYPALDPEDRLAYEKHEAYLGQLIFITKKVEMLVDELLSKSDLPPVIVLQSDTGPNRYMRKPEYELLDETFMKERLKILNAYFFPDNGTELLYQSITPVNSFRIIFNHYFAADYELLKDESYFGSLIPYSLTIVPP